MLGESHKGVSNGFFFFRLSQAEEHNVLEKCDLLNTNILFTFLLLPFNTIYSCIR